MGLQNQLSDISSESIPILLITVIAKGVCYLRALFSAILQSIVGGVLKSGHVDQIDGPVYDVVGSGLAGVVFLAEQLNLNRVFTYSYFDKEDPNSKCVVCLNKFKDGEKVRKLACRHVFHQDCFEGWLEHLNFNCPLCRLSLVPDERVELTRRRIGEEGLKWFGMR